ncbi:MAG: CHAT domain-containing tetratricopeptide repeat protein [Blastocatellia bacterium]
MSARAWQDVAALDPGKPVEREIAGGETHAYRITLAAGQYLRVMVEQRSDDLITTLYAPDDRRLGEYDCRWSGAEPVSVIADAAGSHRLTVRTLQKAANRGAYQVRIEELRESVPQDNARLVAEKSSTEAKRLIDQGTAQSLRGAKERLETALPLWQSIGDRSGEAQTLNSLGFLLERFGEPRLALERYQQALQLRQAVNDRYGEGETLHNIAAAHSALGDPKKALELYKQAINVRNALGDRVGEASALNNIAKIHFSRGDYREALESFNQALPLLESAGDRQVQSQTLIGLSAVYYLIGERQKALDYLNRSLPLSRAIKDHRGTAASLNNLGAIYKDLGEWQKALDHYKQALPFFRAVTDRRNEAATLNNLGTISSLLDQRQKALDYYDQAVAIWRAIGDRFGEAQTLLGIGKAFDEIDEKQKALAHYSQALSIFREAGGRRWEAVALHNLGALYDSTGDWRKACDLFSQSLTLWQAMGDRSGEATTRAYLARVERDRGGLNEARNQIEAALDIIEALRVKVADHNLRATYFASARQSYEFYIDLLMRMRRQRPSGGFDAIALQASERARARSLLELLTEAHADIRQGVDSALLERERDLRRNLNAKALIQMRLLRGKPTPEQAAAAANEVETFTAAYREIEAQIRVASPRYAALTQPQPLKLNEIQQQLLDEDTVLLEYTLGAERSYLWAVTPASISGFELPKRTEIETAARRVYDLLTARNQSAPNETTAQRRLRLDQAEAQYPQAAAALSQMLIGPVAAQLGGKRLLIVADGALQYIPFGALPEPVAGARKLAVGGASTEAARKTRDNQSPSANYRPLIVDHEIVNLPSASTLAALRRELAGRSPAPKLVAVLADPVFELDDSRVRQKTDKTTSPSISPTANPTGSPTDHSEAAPTAESDLTRSATETDAINAVRRLQRLLFSGEEAKAILSLAPAGDALKALDFAASRATAMSDDLSQYRIVHFSAHGLLNNLHPELSGIVLSLVDEHGKPQDGFLRLHDIYNLKLPAELIVLSVCQTALGKEIRGEGLVGLTRGFMYAGAARVVASLWKVDDRASAELMKNFYREILKRKQRPAAALRAAQVAMWRSSRWQSPYYWAAFTLQGEWH